MAAYIDTFMDEFQRYTAHFRQTRPDLDTRQCRQEALRQTTVHKRASVMLASLKSFKFDRRVIFPQEMPPSYCFRIRFDVEGIDNHGFDGLSISAPPDESSNCFETALFLGDELTYVGDVGYEDIVRFYGDNNDDVVNQIVEEINRLVGILNNQ
jgi:hypothetical protein